MTEALRVVAVVPAYDPAPGLVALVGDLLAQTAAVVVVDDGSPHTDTELWDACRAAGATVLRHETNRGIAAALNTGIDWARADAADAVITVDQDSAVPPAFVDALVDRWTTLQDRGFRVGVVAPEVVEGLPPQRDGRPPIQSGLLVPMTTVEQVGRFDEGLFIDGVDDDFALRCLDEGLSIQIAADLRLTHSLGALRRGRLLGLPVRVVASAPNRYYFMGRNRSRLVRRHGRRHPLWAAHQVLGLIRHLTVIQLVLPGRRERARQLVRGLSDRESPNGDSAISGRPRH